MAVAATHGDRLKELKQTVEDAHDYFKENIDRFEKFTKFVFKTSMKDDEAATLASNGKPNIEFNILEAFVSRLRGEFARQEPGISVRAADGVPSSMLDRNFSETLNLIEAHLKYLSDDGTTDMLKYNVYTDLLVGGWSVMRVYTEYINEKSFEQNILCERVFNPTLTVFDGLARKSHKGDGRFCAELYPMTKKAFEEEFGKEAADEMSYTRQLSGFDWSFQREKEKILLVCDFYEKKQKRVKIFKCTDGKSRTQKEYDKFLEDWETQGRIEQPPLPDGHHERWTNIEYICRYRFCESKVLDYIETDYKYLPLVFVDGNSIIINEAEAYTQFCKPYVYHAEGAQRLKNYAGQSLANELENTISHKFLVPIESIPTDASLSEAYRNVQKPDVLLYNHFKDPNNMDVTLPPPTIVARTPIPPEISGTFNGSDNTIQMTLGSFDNQQGVQNAPLSGVAFARSAITSNTAATPYLVGWIKGWNRVCEIVLDLIPKYYRTPRTLPILTPEGKRSYVEINKKGSLFMNFDPNHLQVHVQAGVNFQMQKEIALQTIIAMSQANQQFAKFMGEEGLSILLDNIDIRGIDQIREKANAWQDKEKQMQAQQMQMQQQQMQAQMQQQQADAQLKSQQQQIQMAQMQKELASPSQTQVEQLYIQQKSEADAANISIKAMDSETKRLEAIAKIEGANVEQELRVAELQAEMERSAIESVVKIGEHIHEINKQEKKND